MPGATARVHVMAASNAYGCSPGALGCVQMHEVAVRLLRHRSEALVGVP